MMFLYILIACCNKESGHPDPVVQVQQFENTGK